MQGFRGATSTSTLTALTGAFVVGVYWLAEFARHALVLDPRGDFTVFYAAGRAVLEGRTPYGDPAFFSPPWTAAWMAPFALLPPEPAQVAWVVLSLGMVALCGALVWRLASARGRPLSKSTTLLVVAVLAALLFYPLRQMFDSAQTDAFALLATVLCVYLDSIDRPLLAGMSLGLGLLNPHLIVGPCVYALARRRWRVIAGGLMGGAVCVAVGVLVVGPGALFVFASRLRFAESYWAARAPQVTVIHTLLQTGLSTETAWGLFAAIAIGAFALGWHALRKSSDPLLALAVCAAITDLVTPFGFAQDYVIMVLALPWMMRALGTARASKMTWLAWFCFSIYLGGVSWLRYPASHDLLHSIAPLCLFPSLWVWRGAMGMENRAMVLALALWGASDVAFGFANPALPLWCDSLAFNLGAAAVLVVTAGEPSAAGRIKGYRAVAPAAGERLGGHASLTPSGSAGG